MELMRMLCRVLRYNKKKSAGFTYLKWHYFFQFLALFCISFAINLYIVCTIFHPFCIILMISIH